jgi:outer membrane protein
MAARLGFTSSSALVLSGSLLLSAGVQAQSVEPPETPMETSPAPPEPAQPTGEAAQVATRVEASPHPADELDARFRRLLGRPGGLTSSQVSSRAVNTSFLVKSKERAIVAAAAEVDKALVRYFPELTLLAQYTRLSSITPGALGPSEGSMVVSPDGTQGPLPPGAPLVEVPFSALSFPVILNQYYLKAGVVVPLSDYFLRINHGVGAAEHSMEAAKLAARAERLAAATGAKLAYYAWVRASMQEVVAGQSLSEAREHRKNAQLGFDAGRLKKADVMMAESRVASAELLLAQAQRMSATTEDSVRTRVHDRGTRRYEIGEDVLKILMMPDTGESVDQLYAEALQKRLEFAIIERRLVAIDRSRRVAMADAYPRLGAFADAYYANPNPRIIPQKQKWQATWDAGVRLTWIPNGILSSRAETRGIDGERARLEAERGALMDAVRGEVMDAYQALREARTNTDSTKRGLAAAEETYRVRQLLFKRGRATSVELMDAETAVLRARLEMINARVNWLVARVSLEHAVGRDVR